MSAFSADATETHIGVAETESFQQRRGISLARDKMRRAEEEQLLQRADFRSEHGQVVGLAKASEHRDPRARGHLVVEREVRIGAHVEVGEKAIDAEENSAQVKCGRALIGPC